MRIQSIILTLLVTLLAVISKGLPSDGAAVENEEQSLLMDIDTLDRQKRDNQNIDTRGKKKPKPQTGPVTAVSVQEGGTLQLWCSLGGKARVKIQKALYGKLNNRQCKKPWKKDTDLVKAQCQNQYNCRVEALNSVFGDPCYGVLKKLTVWYSCIGKRSGVHGEKSFKDFKTNAALHFDESIANLTVSSSEGTKTTCGPSNVEPYQSNHFKCGISQFDKCATSLFKAITTCIKAEGISGVYFCAKKIIKTTIACVPCICKGIFIHIDAIPNGCKACDGSPSVCPNSWLVPIGGVNDGQRLRSAEIITSTGVCTTDHPKLLPPLSAPTTAGMSAWINDELIFCGGSTTFTDFKNAEPWGATDQCFGVKPAPGVIQWDTIGSMKAKRSFATLTVLDSENVAAAGGLNDNNGALKSIEVYSTVTKKWTLNGTIGANPRYGHCAVHYVEAGISYLIIIGGSQTDPDAGSPGVLVPVNVVTQIPMNGNVPYNLKTLPQALWSPGCSMDGGSIYLSGGSKGNLNEAAENQVYKFDFEPSAGLGTWTTLGTLQSPRYGHVMGTIGTQLVVAGGFNGTGEFYASIETSKNGGSLGYIWELRRTDLLQAREFAALAEVEDGTFSVNC